MPYSTYMNEHKELLDTITNEELYKYLMRNMRSSLLSIGFSEEFVCYFVNNFSELDFVEFYTLFGEELSRVYDIGFFQKIVPEYFRNEVHAHIPESNTILDVGCGTGLLIHSLSNNPKFKNLIGIDICEYAQWEQFKNPKIQFKIINENEFENFIKEVKPDNVLITWTLHHMDQLIMQTIQTHNKRTHNGESHSTIWE